MKYNIRNLIRNGFYFIRGYDADRFSAPVFHIKTVRDLLNVEGEFSSLRLIVPREKCTWSSGFRFEKETHPFVSAMVSGEKKGLHDFYEKYQPKNILERYFLNEHRNTLLISLPWSSVKMKGELIEDEGPGIEHGHQWFGPVTEKKIDLEYRRCISCYNSIKEKGYMPHSHGGFPRGHFLIGKDDFCFQVEGGQHRLAALAALNWDGIEVMSIGKPFNFINKEDVEKWPAVLKGRINKTDAAKIFDLHLHNGNIENHKSLFS